MHFYVKQTDFSQLRKKLELFIHNFIDEVLPQHSTNPCFHHNWERNSRVFLLWGHLSSSGEKEMDSAYFVKCIINNSGLRPYAPVPLEKQWNRVPTWPTALGHTRLCSRGVRPAMSPLPRTRASRHQRLTSWLQPGEWNRTTLDEGS